MLPREILHDIVFFISSPLSLYQYLCALPLCELNVPLVCLKKLLNDQLCGKLPCQIWPVLDLSSDLINYEVLKRIQPCVGLYGLINCQSPPKPIPLLLDCNTKICFNSLDSPADFKFVNKAMIHQIKSLTMHLWDRFENMWTMEEIISLSHQIKALSSLKSLVVRWQLTQSQAAFEFVLAGILSSQITCLKINVSKSSGVVWTKRIVQSFAMWLKTNPIYHIELEGIQISGECSELMADALRNCDTLQTIVLHDNILQQAFFHDKISQNLKTVVATGVQACSLPFISNSIVSSSVHTLKLHFQYPSPTEEIANGFIIECLPTLSHLRKLELTHLTLPNATIKSIATILPQLHELSLESNELEDAGIITLVGQLPVCHKLYSLRLDNQGCTDIGALSIVQALKHCTSLKKLYLGRNRIGSNGAKILSTIIPQLTTLDLTRNLIQDDGAIAFSQVIPLTNSMDILDLKMNPFNKVGVMSIIHALSFSTHRHGIIGLKCTVQNQRDFVACWSAINNLPNPNWCIF